MHAFDYVAPQNVAEAVAVLAREGDQAGVLGGGTDLLVQLREGRRRVKCLVDVKKIPALTQLSYDPIQGLRLGAAVPCYRIYGQAEVAAAYPGLIDAASLIGGIQIQGRATFGGNLCNASPAADSIPALIVHEAVCLIAGPNGRRKVAVEDFCTGPGMTVLQPDEILVSFHLPPPKNGFGANYQRFTPRNEMDIAVVGVGASVVLDADRKTIVSARIALGAVAPTPLLVREAGTALAGQPISRAVLEQAARLAQAAARPINDMRGTIEQRKHLSAVLTRRTLQKAIERAKEV